MTPIAFHRVADLELHHRHAGKAGAQPGAGEIVPHGLADFAHHLGQSLALDDVGIEREHDQRQVPGFREQLALDQFVVEDAFDERLVFGVVGRQFLREKRRGQLARDRRLPRREQRDDAARAIDELEVGDEVAQALDRLPRQEGRPVDDHEDVELARREAVRDRLVLLEFGGVRPEQLAQRIIDLDALDAERRRNGKDENDDCPYRRMTQRQKADALGAEGEIVRLARPGRERTALFACLFRRHAASPEIPY